MRFVVQLLLTIIVIAVVAWWRRQRGLATHKGLSREEFVRYFAEIDVPDVVSGEVYDHFREMVGVRGYRPSPTDSFEETFKMSGEDFDDELKELLPRLGLEIPHSGKLRDWTRPLATLSDLVQWINWVRSNSKAEID
ncbi:MAG: hypothetical protein ABL967_19645 [Bryobacteraceae bacterium]